MKNTAFIKLFVLIIVGAGMISLSVYGHRELKKRPAPVQPTPLAMHSYTESDYTPPPTPLPKIYVPYTHAQAGFSLDYPQDWDVEAGGTMVALSKPDSTTIRAECLAQGASEDTCDAYGYTADVKILIIHGQTAAAYLANPDRVNLGLQTIGTTQGTGFSEYDRGLTHYGVAIEHNNTLYVVYMMRCSDASTMNSVERHIYGSFTFTR
jgi:hypothetical protein